MATFKSAVHDSAVTVIGFSKSRHRDWFDDQDVEARQLLDTMHAMHLAWINDKSNSSVKSAYTRARGEAQKRLRQMKNEWLGQQSLRATARSRLEGHEDFLLRSTVPGIQAVYSCALTMVRLSSPVDKAYYLAGQHTFTMSSTRRHHYAESHSELGCKYGPDAASHCC